MWSAGLPDGWAFPERYGAIAEAGRNEGGNEIVKVEAKMRDYFLFYGGRCCFLLGVRAEPTQKTGKLSPIGYSKGKGDR